MTIVRAACAWLVVFGLAACSAVSTNATANATLPQARALVTGSRGTSGSIQHVVIVIQENRSFDNLFATFPGADGATEGKMSTGRTVKLTEAALQFPCDFGHSRSGYLKSYDKGKMDGFNLEGGSAKCPGQAGKRPYQYVNPSDIAPYWDIAGQYVLADHMFQTQGSGSFTAHQDLIAGGTAINVRESLVDFPSHSPWGCDAPAGTVTSLVKGNGTSPQPVKLIYLYHKGPFPCMTYATMRDLLDAKSVTWKYYTPTIAGSGAIWNAFDGISAVRYGSEWETNVISPETEIFSDISGGTLPSVSWVIPDNTNSDHPGSGEDKGPSWVASVVNAIGESSYWPNTAIVVVWDDWGGFYDHVAPPFRDNYGGLGFRVPMLVISPYARQGVSGPGYVSSTQYEFGSILKFVEDVWGLGRLNTTDTRARSIVDCFDFTQQPRPFTAIPSEYSVRYFENERPSGQPVDSE